jgi:glycosyltransferase involved in cell wall biosynthesis
VPLVSVVIPTFGRPALVTRAVRDALAQTFADLEVVVIIDGDDPATVEALRAVGDPRLRVIVNAEKKGAGPTRDAGVGASRGRWIAFLDDDDEWDPTKLEKQVAAVADDPMTICTTLSRVVNAAGTLIRPTRPYDGRQPIDEWLFGRRTWLKTTDALLQTSSLLMPRRVFDSLQFGRVRHEEWELVIRAVKQLGYRLVTVREPLVTYYQGNVYAWRRSVEWVDTVRDLLSPEAYSGFCLTVATQGVQEAERNDAMRTLLNKALRNGRPTAKQLFAFSLIWSLPDTVRHRVRARLSRPDGAGTSASGDPGAGTAGAPRSAT